MVKQQLFRLFLFLLLANAACTSKKEEAADSEVESSDTWQAMDDFHMVMAESFHPYKDSANLGPAKANADSLLAAADKWLNSAIPTKVDNAEFKEKLQQLKHEAEEFVILAQTDDDKAIAESLTQVHDLFHQLQEEWYGGHDEHHEHH